MTYAWSWADVPGLDPETHLPLGPPLSIPMSAEPATHAVWCGTAGAYLNADADGFAREIDPPGLWPRDEAERIVRSRPRGEACAALPFGGG